MTQSQNRRVRGLRANGYSVKDIVGLTKYPMDEVLYVLSKPKEPEDPLLELAKRMLKCVPTWWTRGEEAYRYCVRMNFADVL